VLTNGFCKTDFTSCNAIDINNGCYPCPVIIETTTNTGNTQSEALTLDNAVVDLINNTDVNEIATLIGDQNADVVNDIETLKQDVCGTDGTCTTDEIQNYLTQP
jgi:hypothetical protein